MMINTKSGYGIAEPKQEQLTFDFHMQGEMLIIRIVGKCWEEDTDNQKIRQVHRMSEIPIIQMRYKKK